MSVISYTVPPYSSELCNSRTSCILNHELNARLPREIWRSNSKVSSIRLDANLSNKESHAPWLVHSWSIECRNIWIPVYERFDHLWEAFRENAMYYICNTFSISILWLLKRAFSISGVRVLCLANLSGLLPFNWPCARDFENLHHTSRCKAVCHRGKLSNNV